MKGTAHRGFWPARDQALARQLHDCPKNRAENAMIVDMIRNDMGRIACPGSIHVEEPFAVERYPTVLQMTSTVSSRTGATLPEVFAAMFPCASITGAPKVRTMQIIRQLESEPRGVYTGAIGMVQPGGRARFNVAIRTVVIDKENGLAEYGVGGGIVWDSRPCEEYAECRTKAAVLTAHFPPFDLLETLRFDPGTGYNLLQEHLDRLAASATYFGYRLDIALVRAELESLAAHLAAPVRVRLTVTESGQVNLETAAAPCINPGAPWRLKLAARPVNKSDVFLYHKTTHRLVYDNARRESPPCDDVLLYNEAGQVTETTIANIVCRIDGRLVTPPLESGLLAGAFRQSLIKNGQVAEQIIRVDQLPHCQELFAVNSVRGWMNAVLLS